MVFNLSRLINGDQLISLNLYDKKFLVNFGGVSLYSDFLDFSCSFLGFRLQFFLSFQILVSDFLFLIFQLQTIVYHSDSHYLSCFQFYFDVSISISLFDFF